MGELWLGRLASGVETGRLVIIRRFSSNRLEPRQLSSIQGSRSWYTRLRHPTIAKLLQVSVTADELLCISEYLEGVQLVDLRREAIDNQATIPPPVAVRMVLDVARATCAAQRLINPPELVAPERLLYSAGVCVTSFGEVLLGDVGILGHLAKTEQARQDPTLVVELAPEELLSGQSSERAEVFTLGVMLWELLANRWLFDRTDLESARDSLCSQPIPQLSSAQRDGLLVPAPVQDLVARATRRAPSERFANVAALARALEELPEQAVAATSQVAEFMSTIAASKFSQHRMSTRWSTRAEAEDARSPVPSRSGFESRTGYDWEPPTLSERRLVVADVTSARLSVSSGGHQREPVAPLQHSMIVAPTSPSYVITVPPVAASDLFPLQYPARQYGRLALAVSALIALLVITVLLIRSSQVPTTNAVEEASRHPHPAAASGQLPSKSMNASLPNADFTSSEKVTAATNGPDLSKGLASAADDKQTTSRPAGAANRETAGKQPGPGSSANGSNPAGSSRSRGAQRVHSSSTFRPKGI